MLFFEVYKIMVKKVTFVGFRGALSSPGSTPASCYVLLNFSSIFSMLNRGVYTHIYFVQTATFQCLHPLNSSLSCVNFSQYNVNF